MHDQKFTFSEVVFSPSTLVGKSANVIKLGKGDTQMFGHFFRSWKFLIGHTAICIKNLGSPRKFTTNNETFYKNCFMMLQKTLIPSKE